MFKNIVRKKVFNVFKKIICFFTAGQKPFKCPRCPVTFSTKSNRERHLIRKHGVNMLDPMSRQTMDRPYKCPLCVFSSFSTQSKLTSATFIALIHRSTEGKFYLRTILIIFLPINLNMCFGCSKESSQWDGSFEYPQHMFWLRNKKIDFWLCTLIWRPEYTYL